MKKKLTAIDLDSMTFIVAYNQAIKNNNLTEAHLVEAHVKSFIDTLLVRTECDVYILVYQGKGHKNFRKYFYPDYKFKRNEKTYDFLDLWKETILDTYKSLDATEVHNIESDDALAIIYKQFRDEYDITLVHSDKDMYQVPCRHCNPVKKVEESFKFINKEEALHNWAIQMLTGDWSTDSILGCAVLIDKVWKSGDKKGEHYLARSGVGPKEAEELLKNAVKFVDVENVLHKTYKDKFGDNWYNEYHKTYKLITMLTSIPTQQIFADDSSLTFKVIKNTVTTAENLFD